MIELKHVTFGYNKKQMVLQDINITIPDGEKDLMSCVRY